MHLHMMSLTPYKYQLYGSYEKKSEEKHPLCPIGTLSSNQQTPLLWITPSRFTTLKNLCCEMPATTPPLAPFSWPSKLPLLLLILYLHVIHASNVKINSHYWHVKRKPPLGRPSGGKRWVGPSSTRIKNRLIWPNKTSWVGLKLNPYSWAWTLSPIGPAHVVGPNPI